MKTYSASGRDEECSEQGDYKPFIISLARRSAVEKIYNDDDTIYHQSGRRWLVVDIYPATNRPGKCPPLAVDANYINPRGGEAE